MKHLLASAMLALIASAPAAFAAAPEPFEASVWADVDVDAQGHVTAATIPGPAEGGKIAEFLLARIKTWQFVPARRNGEAVPAQTSLEIRLAIREEGKEYSLSVLRAEPSPRLLTSTPPRYPLAALRRRTEARVVVDFDVQPDGKVTGATVREPGDKALDAASIAAVKGWTFKPERVDGIAVATHTAAPITYVIRRVDGRSSKERRTLDGKWAQELAAESAVKLQTKVAEL